MSFIYIVIFCIFTDAFYPVCRVFHLNKKTEHTMNLFFPRLEDRNDSFSNTYKQGHDTHIKENKIYEYSLLEQIAIYHSYMILLNRIKLPSISNDEKLDMICQYPITANLQNKEIKIVNIYSGGLYNNWNDSDIKYN